MVCVGSSPTSCTNINLKTNNYANKGNGRNITWSIKDT